MTSGVTEADIATSLRPFIRKKDKIEASTRIYHDLHIAGDDAAELLEDIAKRYGVSFEELDFHRYFPNDLDAFIYFWARRLFGYRDKVHVPMTVGHLAAVVQRGAWFDPAWTMSFEKSSP